MRGLNWVGLVSGAGLFVFAVGCPPSSSTPAKTSPTATVAAQTCAEGATKCTGSYGGEVAEGNDAPAGASVAVCKDGAWSETECDASVNEGCYSVEDPGSGDMIARCLAADSPGE